MTVETVYSQIIDDQTLNITVLGQAASEILGTGTNLGMFGAVELTSSPA